MEEFIKKGGMPEYFAVIFLLYFNYYPNLN